MVELLDPEDQDLLREKYIPKIMEYVGVSPDILDDYPYVVIRNINLEFALTEGYINVTLKFGISKSVGGKKIQTQSASLIDFNLRQLDGACGVLVFYNGGAHCITDCDDLYYWSCEYYNTRSYGPSPFGYMPGKGHKLWSIVIDLVKDYARLTNYGVVLATDNDESSSDTLASQLGIPIMYGFTSPRTKRDISMYLIDISNDMEFKGPTKEEQKTYAKVISGPILLPHNKMNAKHKTSKQTVSRKLSTK